jgi:hypothetical protein
MYPPVSALEHMEYLLVGMELLPIYQHFFPREYARQKINFASGDSVRDALFRFSELVDDRLFPVWPFSCMDFIEGISEIAADIPLRPSGFALEDRECDGETTELDELFVRLSSIGDNDWMLDDGQLRADCERRRDPFKWLQVARSIALGYTGNWYVDVSEQLMCESGELPSWSKDTVKWLAADYKEAQQMMARYARFTKWVLTKPERMKQAEKILMGHYKSRARARVTVPAGRPLVEILV